MEVICNNCGWEGDEDSLSLFETVGDGTETITSEQTPSKLIIHQARPENPFYFKGCPNCKTDGYLMDMDDLKELVVE